MYMSVAVYQVKAAKDLTLPIFHLHIAIKRSIFQILSYELEMPGAGESE